MKVLFIGLDCATPQLVFDKWRDELKNISSLMNNGVYAKLKSTIPPITTPAWACMFTGKDPGTLGFYGFRNRKKYDYSELSIVNAKFVKDKAVWDYLSEIGKKSFVMGFPPSYPPKKMNGWMISCFLTPSTDSQYTYPDDLKMEIEERFGNYIFDVSGFRTEDKDGLLRRLYEMSEQRFNIAKYFIKTKPWDFFMFVDMGIDRFHHAFWKYIDPEHNKFVPGNRYEQAGLEYYKFIDAKIGELLELLDDDTVVIVASDHGAKRMNGAICINEWLIKNGYLTLKTKPGNVTRLTMDMIDFSKTKAWGSGGYYSRIFLNVKNREPEGIVEPSDYEKVRNELKIRIEKLPDDKGNDIGTTVYKPEETYRRVNKIPPDLIVIFGDLYWRSAGTIGHNTFWLHENDTGPDDANHAQHGIFVMSNSKFGVHADEKSINILDVGPTILDLFGYEIPSDIQGKILNI
ncbi:alkaline phosphatase family protein [bacterium]|nr:alkaline phosphatase family protein [bacterium]